MTLSIDEFAILRGIGSDPETFSAISKDVSAKVRVWVLKHLKAKSTDLEKLRRTNDALGNQAFALFVDGMKDTDVRSIINRLDKHRLTIGSVDEAWKQRHLVALATGAVDPTKSESRPSRSGPPKSNRLAEKNELGLSSKAMAAVRRREPDQKDK